MRPNQRSNSYEGSWDPRKPSINYTKGFFDSLGRSPHFSKIPPIKNHVWGFHIQVYSPRCLRESMITGGNAHKSMKREFVETSFDLLQSRMFQLLICFDVYWSSHLGFSAEPGFLMRGSNAIFTAFRFRSSLMKSSCSGTETKFDPESFDSNWIPPLFKYRWASLVSSRKTVKESAGTVPRLLTPAKISRTCWPVGMIDSEAPCQRAIGPDQLTLKTLI